MIERGRIADGLTRFLRIPGRLTLDVARDVSPTIDVLELARRSPYGALGFPCAGVLSPGGGGAGIFGYVWVSPGLNVALSIEKIIISQSSAASNFTVRLLTQAQQVTVGVDAFQQLTRMQQSVQGPGGPFPEPAASVIDRGLHNAVVGTELFSDVCQIAPAKTEIDLRDVAPVLYGVPQGTSQTIQALAVICETANVNFRAAFLCREWPYEGVPG